MIHIATLQDREVASDLCELLLGCDSTIKFTVSPVSHPFTLFTPTSHLSL